MFISFADKDMYYECFDITSSDGQTRYKEYLERGLEV
jgi:hypothetical protein